MKKMIRKTRLVLTCMNLGGGLLRFLAALVDMASNYSCHRDAEVDASVRTEAWSLGLRTY